MYCGADVNDGVEWSNQRNYDYHDDAQTLLRRLDAKEGGDVEEEFKYTPEPDSQLNLDANSASVALSFHPPATKIKSVNFLCFHREVVYDDEVGVHFDVLLTKIDVNAGFYGLYNFYKMQASCTTLPCLHLLIR